MTQTKARYEIYRDTADRRWRWRFRDAEGRDIGQSSQAYQERGDCLRAIVCIRGSGDFGIHQLRPPRPPRKRLARTRTPGRVIDFPNRKEVLECRTQGGTRDSIG